MDLFVRMRDLAFQDPTLNAIFGPTFDANKFRWFRIQQMPGQLPKGTCCTVNVVSTVFHNLHGVPMRNSLNEPRVDINIIDPNPLVASSAAEAVKLFMDFANFWQNGAFASPRRIDPPGTNALLNQRGSFLTVQTDRPIPVELLEYRVKNVDT